MLRLLSVLLRLADQVRVEMRLGGKVAHRRDGLKVGAELALRQVLQQFTIHHHTIAMLYLVPRWQDRVLH